MAIEVSSVAPAPVEEVFAWFARPGAFQRLTPPWSGVKLVSQTASLRDGEAVLRFPLGLRWTAKHDPSGFIPGVQFVDEVSSTPFRQLTGGWRHVHTFAPADGGGTLVGDQVFTRVPRAVLAPMFAFRHRQLAADLAAQARSRAWHDGPQPTVALTGATGLVGTALSAFLTTAGHRVIHLVRGKATGPDQRHWDPIDPDDDLLAGVDALVHLAGTSIAGRFTEAHRTAIRDSRIGPTRKLAELVARNGSDTKAMVCASAVGYYGADRGDETLDETAGLGEGFLAEVVADWEAACAPVVAAGKRLVNVRTGVVQSGRGGMLPLLRLLFSTGLGGRIGDGSTWLAWIALDDLVDVYHRAIQDETITGPVNAVAPNPVRNAEYTRALAAAVHRPAVLPVPAFGPRLLLGDVGARELVMSSQRATPAKLLSARHVFRFPAVEAALFHELGSS